LLPDRSTASYVAGGAVEESALDLTRVPTAMSVQVAEYLRHLAVRCTRLSRDCYDPLVAKELELVSVELVEQAEALEAFLSRLSPLKQNPPSS
jgi:hypothetical protein